MNDRQTEVFTRLASALQKFTTSASALVGADCMLHAQMAQLLLQEEGIQTRVVVGEAAWRIGSGDGDVITHSPRIGGFAPAGMKALAYHAWLESDTMAVIDFSTHSLRVKASLLDALDGGTTTVEWCPAYLVMEKSPGLSIKDVGQAPSAGVAAYGKIPELLEAITKSGLTTPPDVEDMSILRFLFDNPHLAVVGPNDRNLCSIGIETAEQQPA